MEDQRNPPLLSRLLNISILALTQWACYHARVVFSSKHHCSASERLYRNSRPFSCSSDCCVALFSEQLYSFLFPRRAKKWALRLNEYILLFQCPKEFLCWPLLIILCHISLWTITYINRILFFFLFIWYSALILGYTSINIRVFAFFSFFFFFEGVQHHVAEAAAARTETVETEACGNNSYDQTQTRI